jgi:RNA polymerase II subunit A small phosphatase-like protein
MLLILDLDETLVYSTTTPLDRAGDFRVAEYVVYQRPGLAPFLRFVARDFETAIWSSSSSGYAQEIISHIFPSPSSLLFVWTRERCTLRFDPETRESYWVKDLKKVKRLGFKLEQTLVVDDSPEKLERNYGNHIRVDPYDGRQEDNELSALAAYLSRIKETPNVRILDKRNWKSQVGAD